MFEKEQHLAEEDKLKSNYKSPSELDIGKRVDYNYKSNLNRLPTLSEVLTRKTSSPVDLWSFYIFMRDKQHAIDYLDFWLDAIHHLSLCKHYVKGLRESILIRNSSQFNLLQEHSHVHDLIMTNDKRQTKESNSSDFIDYNSSSNRTSRVSQKQQQQQQQDQRVKSLSSSLLLEMIVNENMLEESNSKRLSLFLRGDLNLESSDPRVKSILEDYNRKDYYDDNYQAYEEEDVASLGYPNNPQPDQSPQSSSQPRRVTSQDQLLSSQQKDGTNFPIDNSKDAQFIKMNAKNRLSTINPELLERIIQDSKLPSFKDNKFITRSNLKESSRNLLLKYFVEDAEKKLFLPESIISNVIQSVDIEGRDDPDVFQPARDYVFKVMENEAFPNFLQSVAISNITDFSFTIRLISGLFFLFIAFWVAYILIFLNHSKDQRAVVLVPFFFGIYLIVSSIYYIDPFLCFLGFAESNASPNGLIRLREYFVKNLLIKRSLWVLFLICFISASLTLIFALVPGHRL